MRAAVLDENSIVINIIEVESLEEFPNLVDVTDSGAIGDLWDGNSFSPSTDYINEIKIKKLLEIKDLRDIKKEDGAYVVSVDKWFHNDVYSRTQHIGLLMLGANIPGGLQWKTMDGTFTTMTQTLAAQIFQAIASSDIGIFNAAETHKNNMLATNDPQNYDFSNNWPATYNYR